MDRMLHSAFPAANRRRSLDFDLFETETGYESLLRTGTDLREGLYGKRTSVYLRYAFELEDLAMIGGLVLHMLRRELGDEPFFDAVREYYRIYRNATADTDDFRRVVEPLGRRLVQRTTLYGRPDLDTLPLETTRRNRVAIPVAGA